MNALVYNISIAVGVALSSVGAGMIYIPAGFIVAGCLIIGLAIFSVELVAKKIRR